MALFGAALVVGAVGSAHCVGMCGPFAIASAKDQGATGVAVYSGGRIATYAVLGALAGSFGALLSLLRSVGFVVAALVLVLVCLQMAGLLPEPKWSGRWSAALFRHAGRRRGLAARWLFGMATALLPCGLVYAAMGVALGAGTPAGGAWVMVGFGLGTSPALVALGAGVGRLGALGPSTRRALALGVAVVGLWALSHRVPAPTNDVPDCCQTEAPVP